MEGWVIGTSKLFIFALSFRRVVWQTIYQLEYEKVIEELVAVF